MNYYSVDRRGYYQEGLLVELQQLAEPGRDEFSQHISAQFSAGMSPHGFLYYGSPQINYSQFSVNNNAALLELLLESVRRASYPTKPSRYQSIFACATVDECVAFRGTHGQRLDPVFQVFPGEAPHRGDMNIYSIAGTSASLDLRLHMYWRGETLNNPSHVPQWEFVIPLPATIGCRVA